MIGRKKSKFGIKKCFSEYPHEDIFIFATETLADFRKSCPWSITSGLFRVDIFQTINGHLVVNEFESLETNYYGSPVEEACVERFLEDYWLEKVDCVVGNMLK